jgi:hypothetical protein
MYKQRFRLTYVNKMGESQRAKSAPSKRHAVRQRRKLEMMRNRCSDVGEARAFAD